jgi:hypothetical protein
VDDPRLAAYHDPGPGHGCALFAPVDHGLGFNAYVLGPRSFHPWIVAARAADAAGSSGTMSELLECYYSMIQPASVRDWLDVPHGSCPRLESIPRHGWSILPWSTRDPEQTLRAIEMAQRDENRLHGLDEGMSAGAKAFGPVSADKLRVESTRITRLFESLKANGLDHRRPDYDLRATFLVSEGRWTWLSMGGMHRVALAAATGVASIPVRVAAVVRRDDVDMWPQVVSGLYERDAALGLFDRLMDRRPPACAAPWIEWVASRGLA